MSSSFKSENYLAMAQVKLPEGKKPPFGLWAVLGAFLAIIIGQTTGVVGFFASLPMLTDQTLMDGLENAEDIINQPMSSEVLGWFLITTTSIPIILIALWIWFFEKRSLASLGMKLSMAGGFQFLRGIVLGIAAMALGVFVLVASGLATLSPPQVPTSWMSIWPLVMLTIGWLVQGTSEEVMFRGLLFQSIGTRHGMMIGAVVSSALFALVHGMNPNTSPLFFVDLIIFSLFACAYTMREKSLWGVSGFHAAWNFAQGHLFGIPVSGMDMSTDKVMSFVETGPDYLTGGTAGLEGGLASTLVLVVSAAVMLLMTSKKPSFDQTTETA